MGTTRTGRASSGSMDCNCDKYSVVWRFESTISGRPLFRAPPPSRSLTFRSRSLAWSRRLRFASLLRGSATSSVPTTPTDQTVLQRSSRNAARAHPCSQSRKLGRAVCPPLSRLYAHAPNRGGRVRLAQAPLGRALSGRPTWLYRGKEPIHLERHATRHRLVAEHRVGAKPYRHLIPS